MTVDSCKLYLTVWRWHFYSAIFVIPFLIMLALTGLVILYGPQIDNVLFGDRLFVAPAGAIKPYSEKLNAVRLGYPEAALTRFRPGTAPIESSAVALSTADRCDLHAAPVFLHSAGVGSF
jgi:uncharacterized iron-regulated membrane protein